MSLKDVKIEKVYYVSDDVVNNFYIPALRETISYKRAVGFFNSAALYEIATGLENLILNNGTIKLIVSPKLEEDDVKAILEGYKTRNEVIENALMREFREPITTFQEKKLNLLANLIADKRLDIKVAFKQNGIFHIKTGIMEDTAGNKIAFGGSMNETYSGLLQNYENIDVFCSWLPEDEERVRLKEQDFDCLWGNNYETMDVIPFPQVAIERINKYKIDSTETILKNYKLDELENSTEFKPKKERGVFFRIPTQEQGFNGLYDYQKEAINNWIDNNGRGIFKMATGTGKTLTALGALAALSKKLNDKFVAIIICPQTHLVEQWVEDINWFGVKPIIAYSDYGWKEDLKKEVRYFNSGVSKHFCIITTNSSYTLPEMQNQINKIRGDICLVVDEAHNFGAKKQRQFMNENIKYRLALSATLERHRDKEGTEALENYFGKVCIDYPLERAIEENKLCRYFYYPIPITLEEDELEVYNQISERISNIMKKFRGKTKDGELPDVVEQLLIKRARIVSGARNKVKKLYELMKEHKSENNILVYCGATKVPNDNYLGFDYEYDYDDNKFDGQSKKQIDIVADMLGNQLGMRVAKFTSAENKKERELIKNNFAEGKMLQCIVAIKCLDEGLNIPGIQKAFILASSTNPKEYIQRRGRVLRKSPNKKFAEIYDFVTFPHDLDSGYVNEQTAYYELSLIKKEVERMKDFQKLAENSSEVDKLITKIENLYQLNVIGGYEDEF